MKDNLIIGLSVLSIVLIGGWVIPEIPFTRRISLKEAESLLEKYRSYYARIVDSSYPDNLTELEIKDGDRIANKLRRAGYVINMNINPNTGVVSADFFKRPLYI